MFKETMNSIICLCSAPLVLKAEKTVHLNSGQMDVVFGSLKCETCDSDYPILAGVAMIVPDPHAYLIEHMKGISRFVADQDIPEAYRNDYLEAKREWEQFEEEHIEEDLESDRVTALYLMNHYLKANELFVPSPFSQALINQYWDHGPFAWVEKNLNQHFYQKKNCRFLELGCSVGGLLNRLPLLEAQSHYLGVDTSFASIALARMIHFYSDDPGNSIVKELCYPGDLLWGALTESLKIVKQDKVNADFIVSDLHALPIKSNKWDAVIAMNAIDMMDDPSVLPKVQRSLLKVQGIAIQTSPYVWHPKVAKFLNPEAKKDFTSEQVILKLYESFDLKITQSESHIPWLFYKHHRQIELYSVHGLMAIRVS